MDIQYLATNWGIGGEWNPSKIFDHCFRLSVLRTHDQMCFELSIGRLIDSDAGVPFRRSTTTGRHSGASIADRVSLKANRAPAAIANLLLCFEWVMTLGCQQKKPMFVPNVLHIRQAFCLACRPLSFRKIDAVLRDQLSVDFLHFLPAWNSAAHIPPVPMPQVTDGNLLNESLGAVCNASVVHTEKSNTSCVNWQEFFIAHKSVGLLRPTPRSRTDPWCRELTESSVRLCAGSTAFVSVPAQYILPTVAKPQPNSSQCVDALRVFVVSLPPKVVTLPSHHHRPHAACQGHRRTNRLVRRLQISRQGRQPRLSLTPQPFRFRLPGSSLPDTDGMRLPCRTRNDCRGRAVFVTRPSSDSPRTLPRASYSGHSPPQRHTQLNRMN